MVHLQIVPVVRLRDRGAVLIIYAGRAVAPRLRRHDVAVLVAVGVPYASRALAVDVGYASACASRWCACRGGRARRRGIGASSSGTRRTYTRSGRPDVNVADNTARRRRRRRPRWPDHAATLAQVGRTTSVTVWASRPPAAPPVTPTTRSATDLRSPERAGRGDEVTARARPGSTALGRRAGALLLMTVVYVSSRPAGVLRRVLRVPRDRGAPGVSVGVAVVWVCQPVLRSPWSVRGCRRRRVGECRAGRHRRGRCCSVRHRRGRGRRVVSRSPARRLRRTALHAAHSSAAARRLPARLPPITRPDPKAHHAHLA